ncbi:bifunctional folylpolyglutamate synthase/dihydrofolate synthase [Lachnospiraceae bacterium OttesenSCG-928-E19]|nr:bifunctional folylpolyglutamate synthase/dihydrofolate synthase [Lachnospiraceae bacterium OttesenSCG-928-E19]
MKNYHYKEACTYIENIPKFTKKHSLTHTERFLKQLGNPCEKKKIIHVAGTNGKGSVCAYMEALLESEGKSVGMFTSPHLVKLNERIKVQNQDVSDEEFCRVFDRTKTIAVEMEQEGLGHPSYFEFLFGMAMLVFEQTEVEYLILETGLGGRLDATNVVKNPLVCIITSIGHDHMEVLGETIEEIASEKAGIIKQGVPLICDGNNSEALSVLQRKCAQLNCSCVGITKKEYEINRISYKNVDFSISSAYYEDIVWKLKCGSKYQPMNAILALEAMRVIAGKEEFAKSLNVWSEALLNVRWPGRMEEVMPRIILDGGHNMEAIQEVIHTIGNQNCSILYAAVSDKDYEGILSYLARHLHARRFILTTLTDSRGVEGQKLAEVVRQESDAEVIVAQNVKDAFEVAVDKKEKDENLYCLGSLYLVGEIKEMIEEEYPC